MQRILLSHPTVAPLPGTVHVTYKHLLNESMKKAVFGDQIIKCSVRCYYGCKGPEGPGVVML